MSIGDFAQLTGLSAKALRLYDEQGLLVPASVDPWSRYRHYSASQLAPAVRLRALRLAGVPLAQAARALGSPEDAAALLDEHRAHLAAERAEQDAALEVLEELVRPGAEPWQVHERTAAAQPWVGVVLPLDPAGSAGDEDTERADAAFAALWRALTAEGNPPTGPFWSSFRASPAGEDSDEGAGSAEVLCCWPLARPVDEGWSLPGHQVVAGEVPAGPELVVRYRHDRPGAQVDGAVHPAVLALLVEAEVRGVHLEPAGLRQVGVVEDGEVVGIEVTVSLVPSG